MVTEKIIDQTVESFDADQDLQIEITHQLMEQYPAIMAYLNQESNDILTEEEKDILWYMTIIIIRSTQEYGYEGLELDSEVLSSTEEKNWEIIQNQKGNFRAKIDVFFINYQEEDLLAFVEDSLEDDGNSPITTVGREVIFISTKALIDTIISDQNQTS